jgi:hypothetical protein
VLDPDAPLALLDQRHAGKRLLLITNSGWGYTRFMMSYAYDRFLPAGTSWRDLFDIVIVGAAKPEFFVHGMPLFEVVDDDGLLRPARRPLPAEGVFLGGSALAVEEMLGLEAPDILYVGDHIYGDVHVSKNVRRWRTALVLRELEGEIEAVERFRPEQARLARLMRRKTRLEGRYSALRLALQRLQAGYGPPVRQPAGEMQAEMAELRARLVRLDEEIGPLARAAAELSSGRWGPLMRTGNDKSHLARQLERHADVYTSRVSNFLYATPFVYLRSPRGSLPHDAGPTHPAPGPDSRTGDG